MPTRPTPSVSVIVPEDEDNVNVRRHLLSRWGSSGLAEDVGGHRERQLIFYVDDCDAQVKAV